MPSTVSDSGELGKGGDETCTRTWYARNPEAGLTKLVSRELTVARYCGIDLADVDLPADSTRRGEVLSDTATVYDNPDATAWTPDQTPTLGEATWTGRATGYTAADEPADWQTVTTTGYDALGRVTSTTDAQGNTSTTSYLPAGAGPLSRLGTVNPLGHKTYEFYEPLRGLPLRSYDVNTKKTEKAYDALGRLTGVWLPNRTRGGGDSPSYKFGYHLHNDKPSYVTTGRINADGDTYTTTYTIYDSLLRTLQTQAPSPHGGRILTDTRYNSRGLAYETYADIFDPTTEPNGTYTRALHGEAPKQTVTTYDGAGRETNNTLLVFGTKKWSTHTTYTGDSTATTARNGGEAKRTITDIRGNIVERRTYAGEQPTDPEFGGTAPGVPYQATTLAYTADGKKKTVNGPDGETWSYDYDLFGRLVQTHDPDRGTTSNSYNNLDQVTSVTDARGESVLTEYDELGRVTGTWANEKTTANRLTGFTYDTVLKGKPTTSTRYQEDGAAYTTEVTEYDTLGHRAEWQLQLPSTDAFVEAGAPSTYAFDAHYTINGLLRSNEMPAMGGLQKEAVSYDYNTLGMLKQIGGSTGYLLDAAYTPTGLPQQFTLGTGGSGNKATYITHDYEQGTGRLTSSEVTTDTHGWMLQDLNYSYDQAGNVTSITDPTTIGGQQAADTQCFDYDGHRRLTEAWTPASGDCTDPRDTDTLGGRAPYWTSYTYNDAGQRTSETDHITGEQDTYCYTGDQPHTLTGISTTGDCANPGRTYGYDATGNTTQRPGQQLTWNAEGNLAKVTENLLDTNYLYGASGNLLIRHTEGGERILYAGDTELHLRADGTMWAQRYYGTQERTIAVRSNATGDTKLSYLATDQHRTATLAIDAGDRQEFVKRALSPFGEKRAEARVGDWVDDKGFLGKAHDSNTGLTHIGARQYDPTTGQFISLDPVMNTKKAGSLNGYTYAENNPLAFTDPTGLDGYPSHCVTRECAQVPIEKQQKLDAPAPPSQGACATLECAVGSGYRPPNYSGYGHCATMQCAMGNGYQAPESVRRRIAIKNELRRQREIARQQAEAERLRREAERESTWSKILGGLKETFGTWEGWKNRVLPALAFGACVVVSVGGCIAAGVVVATATAAGDWMVTGEFDRGAYFRSLAWTAFGGGAAFKFARWGGASRFEALRVGAITKHRVRVRPATTTSGAIYRNGSINWKASGRNMAENTGFNFGFCGAGNASAGKMIGSC